jgi:hypothetical protein
LKGDQWGFLPGPGAGIAGVTSVRATVFLIISAGGCAWRAALDIAATKFAAGCAEGGQGAKDTPRPAEGGRTARPLGNRSRGRHPALAEKLFKKFGRKICGRDARDCGGRTSAFRAVHRAVDRSQSRETQDAAAGSTTW